MSRMLAFDLEGFRFNLRAAAVIRRGDEVLFHRAARKNYWTLPGGRCELGETVFATIEREMREELNVPAKAERMLWFVENHFPYQGRRWHEWLLVVLTSLPGDAPPLQAREPWFSEDGGYTWEWRWLSPTDRASTLIYPPFLPAGLEQLPEHPVHVVSTER